MFSYFPLQIPNVGEVMITIETDRKSNELYVVGKLFKVKNIFADMSEPDDRYSLEPFYTKKIKKIEHPEKDFPEWIELVCDSFVEEVEKNNGKPKEINNLGKALSKDDENERKRAF